MQGSKKSMTPSHGQISGSGDAAIVTARDRRRPFKNGKMQGSKKIQAARCIEQISGPDFLADAADRRFSI
jgi:hypothetical protein